MRHGGTRVAKAVNLEVTVSGLVVGWALLEGVSNGSSPEGLQAAIAQAVKEAVALVEAPERVARKSAVRNLLRHGNYKPTGRGKPASEYLLAAAVAGKFPSINLLADLNNLISLETLLPISVVDLDLVGADCFSVRRGKPGEYYIFNGSGQVLELEDLLLAARSPGDEPFATPVKDRHSTKTGPETRRALALVYAPESCSVVAEAATRRFAELSERFAGASAAWGMVSL